MGDRLGTDARSRRWRSFLPAVAFLVGSGAMNSIQAAPIRHGQRPDPQEMRVLDGFLWRGPNYWATHALPTVPAGISIMNADGALKSDLFVAYLEWRWARHPALFDQRHPHVGTVLTAAAKAGDFNSADAAKGLTVPTVDSLVAQAVFRRDEAHAAALTTIHAEAQVLGGPASVPEPTTWILGVALAASAAIGRRRAERAARAVAG